MDISIFVCTSIVHKIFKQETDLLLLYLHNDRYKTFTPDLGREISLSPYKAVSNK